MSASKFIRLRDYRMLVEPRNYYNDNLRSYADKVVEYFVTFIGIQNLPLATNDMDAWEQLCIPLSHMLPHNSVAIQDDSPVEFMGFTLVKKTHVRFSKKVEYIELTRGDEKAIMVFWGRRFFRNDFTIHTTSEKLLDEAIIASMLQQSG